MNAFLIGQEEGSMSQILNVKQCYKPTYLFIFPSFKFKFKFKFKSIRCVHVKFYNVCNLFYTISRYKNECVKVN